MILADDQYNLVWDKVDKDLHFRPTVDTRITPFVISGPYKVFDIRGTAEITCAQFDRLITGAFINCTAPGDHLYALDWHHSAFLFDPRDPEQMKSIYIEDSRYYGGGYYAHFPPYYPDGDYYFFIDEQFRFGYLSHPWREEVWIFGKGLMDEFDKIYAQLGWTIREDL